MNGKVTFVVSVVLICAVIGSAAEVEWTGKGAGDLWSTAGNWEGGKAPVASDVIVLRSPPERGPVIDSEVICGEIRGPAWKGDRQTVDVVDGANVKIGGWWRFAESGSCVGTINVLGGNVTIDGVLRCANGSRAKGIVNVVDGVIRADGMWLSDTGGGEMNVSGNSLVEFVNNLSFGGNRGKLPMTINMNGGIIRVGRQLRSPHNSARAGMAAINLAGGIIDCASFSHADVAYSMDITEGEFRIKGDVTAEIKEDIGSGYIKAFGGKGSVLCKYDAARDRTIVMAAGRKSAWNPQPGNRAEQVRPDAMLKWNPGKDAQTYNIYLGTSLAAVRSGAKAYRKGEKVPEIQPGLKFNQTYYWRVDTVDKAGGVAVGTVWQLTTTDGKTAAPNPQDDAIAVGVDAILAWRPGLVAASHNIYLSTNYNRVKNATAPAVGKLSKKGFTPEKLELGRTYYWRVDAVNSKWSESPWKGDTWSFTVDEGKAENPRPVNKGLWTPMKVTLSWDGARTAVSHNVYFGEHIKGMKLVSSGKKEATYAAGPLKEATTYFWRIEEIHASGQKVKGDVWQFSTEGLLDLKVDLAVPQWNDRSKYREGTAKKGWFIWASSRWADMYMHDAGWLPEGNGNDAEGVLGSGIQFYLDNGKGGNGTVMAKGLCRGSLAGDMPPYGEPEGDPIANTYFYACDWGGQKNGDCFLLIRGLPAGEYEMTSYHNHWEPCAQQTRNCHLCESGMPPMPSVTANPVPVEGFPGYGGWALPKGTGKGVVSLVSAKDIKVSSVLKDEDVTKSYIRFTTDGSDVLVIYEAPDNTYPDRARRGREGSRGILNAFELKLIEARSGSGPKQVKDIFSGDKPGISWDGSVWYLDSDPERLFVNSDGDLEWTPKGREQFITSIPEQRLSKVGDVVEKSYMFMSDGDHDCEDCLKCPDSCFDDDITCLAGTSDIRVGLFESVERGPEHDGYKGFKGYNFRFGPNMMAGPTRWVDCTREVHKTGMFGKKPVNRGDLMSRNSGLMGRIPGFELKPGEYSFFNVRLERLSAKTVQLSITLNDRTIRYTDDSADDQPQKIDVFAVSMRNKRPYTRLVLRAL